MPYINRRTYGFVPPLSVSLPSRVFTVDVTLTDAAACFNTFVRSTHLSIHHKYKKNHSIIKHIHYSARLTRRVNTMLEEFRLLTADRVAETVIHHASVYLHFPFLNLMSTQMDYIYRINYTSHERGDIDFVPSFSPASFN